MISPSFILKGFDSTFGWLNLMWLRNVPEELLTSLMYQLPSLHQSSQCFLLTTLDLKPTAAAEGPLGVFSGMLSRSEYRPTRIIADSSGNVRWMVGNCNEGRPALGSWCGMKRMDGRCFTADAPSTPLSRASPFDGPADAVGTGPELLRTVSGGWAVSARFLVMLAGDAGGESFEGWRASVSVCLREGGGGRLAALWEEVARNGDAGGVCVEARGRVLECLGDSSRGSSAVPPEWRCRFLRKLSPRRPDGRDTGEFGDIVVAVTVGATGAGAVNITRSGVDEGQPGSWEP